MICPKCNNVLRVAARDGVEIDYCPNCRGIWLDKGELDKIIKNTEEYYKRPDRDDDDFFEGDNHKNHQHKSHRKGKKSFLGDLFDF